MLVTALFCSQKVHFPHTPHLLNSYLLIQYSYEGLCSTVRVIYIFIIIMIKGLDFVLQIYFVCVGFSGVFFVTLNLVQIFNLSVSQSVRSECMSMFINQVKSSNYVYSMSGSLLSHLRVLLLTSKKVGLAKIIYIPKNLFNWGISICISYSGFHS